ncbi:hypothetical protein ACG02S_07755 [Roseateles sp. DC23W]|uniref:Minor tail protein n=1 Tax=Pelomonas dachongensis TaxID=3299029 RepID=A0ABW7EM79_9BURK
MSYGIVVYTADGNLAVSSQAVALHYLGQPVFTGSVFESGVDGSFARFTITSPNGAPLPVFRMTPGDGNWAEAPVVRLVSGTTYEILVRASVTPQVYCFGRLAAATAPAEAWGARVLGASAEVQWDTTRKPLLVHSFVTLPAVSGLPTGGVWDSTAATLPTYPGVVVAAVGGAGGGYQFGSRTVNVAMRLSSNAIDRVVGSRWTSTGGSPDSAPLLQGGLGPAPTLIIDLTPYL